MSHSVNGQLNGAPVAGSAANEDIQEPLLPREQQQPASTHGILSACTESVRSGWLSMCGYLYDNGTGTWSDGAAPRPDGAPPWLASLTQSCLHVSLRALIRLRPLELYPCCWSPATVLIVTICALHVLTTDNT
jgi:hypothetical protein